MFIDLVKIQFVKVLCTTKNNMKKVFNFGCHDITKPQFLFKKNFFTDLCIKVFPFQGLFKEITQKLENVFVCTLLSFSILQDILKHLPNFM